MANDQKPVISVRKLRKVYMMGQEHVVALHNIDLDIPRGEVCCIFGTSGSGKSTLLNQLAGLEKPTRGVVRIGGVPMVFEDIVKREPYSVEEKAEEIVQRVKLAGITRFLLLFKGSRSRSELVATFMAVLELCKKHVLRLAGGPEDCMVSCGKENEV